MTNYVDQASQAQVQGQVFGKGFFSGQAQSQNGGISQSQVQLSGVGIRGQIARYGYVHIGFLFSIINVQ